MVMLKQSALVLALGFALHSAAFADSSPVSTVADPFDSIALPVPLPVPSVNQAALSVPGVTPTIPQVAPLAGGNDTAPVDLALPSLTSTLPQSPAVVHLPEVPTLPGSVNAVIAPSTPPVAVVPANSSMPVLVTTPGNLPNVIVQPVTTPGPSASLPSAPPSESGESSQANDTPAMVKIPRYAANAAKMIHKPKGKPAKITPEVTITPVNDADLIDVTDIDKRLATLDAHARHYPITYTDRRERRAAEEDAKQLVKDLDQYAAAPNASFEVLMRAMHANQLARNLDVGNESALKAGVYIQRALALNPTDAEANFWYGTILAEGGGMKEAIPYLTKAIKGGYSEAYLGLANAYLSLEKRPQAVTTLEQYKAVATDKTQAETVLDAVRNGQNSVWAPN